MANDDGSINLRATMISLREKMSGLSESEQAAAASAIFGKNAMAGWLAVINASDEDFANLTAAIDTCDGKSEEMATTMQDNLAGQLTILKSQLEELAISFGEICGCGRTTHWAICGMSLKNWRRRIPPAL